MLSTLNDALKGKKTYITALAAVMVAAGSYLLGDVSAADAIQMVLVAVLGGTLRHGIKTETTSE